MIWILDTVHWKSFFPDVVVLVDCHRLIENSVTACPTIKLCSQSERGGISSEYYICISYP